MKFSGLSVIEDRNLDSAVGYAYLGNGFLCTLCVHGNSGLHHGRKRTKSRGILSTFGRQTESTENWEKHLGLRNGWQFLFLLLTSNALTNQIGRKSKTAQLWPECLYAYPLLAKYSMPARQIDKFGPLHTLKSVVVSSKNWLSVKKIVF